MSKKTLKAETPVGVFSRTTNSNYTHIVVRESEWMKKMAARKNPGKWAKDRGWVVTWHGSHYAALSAASGKYSYDPDAIVVGVFEVTE